MSADNGIYLLEMKDQWRVIHAQAIENLHWSNIDNDYADDYNSVRIVELYRKVTPMNEEEALKEAQRLYEEIMDDDFCPILEYGIVHLFVDKTWSEIIDEAKELIPQEIESIKLYNDYEPKRRYYKNEIKLLEKLYKEIE